MYAYYKNFRFTMLLDSSIITTTSTNNNNTTATINMVNHHLNNSNGKFALTFASDSMGDELTVIK